MLRNLFIVVVLAVLGVTHVGAAGTLTCTPSSGGRSYSCVWTSDASGDVNGNAQKIGEGRRLISVRIVPGSGGTQPSDQYDVALKDGAGIDLLNSEGLNQSNSLGEYIQHESPLVIGGSTFDVVISNAGNAKTGTVEVWVQ